MPTITTAVDLVLSTPVVTWYRWHLHLTCACEHPRTASMARTCPDPETRLRDVVPRLRCQRCGTAPVRVAVRTGLQTTTGWEDEVVLVEAAR